MKNVNTDKLSTIENIAAEEIVKADRRPWYVTPYAQIRRAHDAGSHTEDIARQMLDAAAAFEPMPGYGERPGYHLTELVDDFSPEEFRDMKVRAFQEAQQQQAGGSTQTAGNAQAAGGSTQTGGGGVE
jgi:hypothetical protein